MNLRRDYSLHETRGGISCCLQNRIPSVHRLHCRDAVREALRRFRLLTLSQFTGAPCQVRRNRTNLFSDTIIYYLLMGCHLLTSFSCNVFAGCN